MCTSSTLLLTGNDYRRASFSLLCFSPLNSLFLFLSPHSKQLFYDAFYTRSLNIVSLLLVNHTHLLEMVLEVVSDTVVSSNVVGGFFLLIRNNSS